jgi:hypothetical protein
MNHFVGVECCDCILLQTWQHVYSLVATLGTVRRGCGRDSHDAEQDMCLRDQAIKSHQTWSGVSAWTQRAHRQSVAVSMHSSQSNMMASATHDLDDHPCTLADDQHSPHLSELVNTPRPPLTLRGQRIAEPQRDSVATRGHMSTIRSYVCRHI